MVPPGSAPCMLLGACSAVKHSDLAGLLTPTAGAGVRRLTAFSSVESGHTGKALQDVQGLQSTSNFTTISIRDKSFTFSTLLKPFFYTNNATDTMMVMSFYTAVVILLLALLNYFLTFELIQLVTFTLKVFKCHYIP